MSLIEYCTIPSRTPLRIAFSTTFWICSWPPSSRKMLGACIGSICQRTATSTCMPICSLESALICSAWSLRSGELLLAGGEPLDVGPRRDEPHAGQERLGVHLAERMAHTHLPGVDHDNARGETRMNAPMTVRSSTGAVRRSRAAGRGGLPWQPGGGGKHQERGDEDDAAQHERTHDFSRGRCWTYLRRCRLASPTASDGRQGARVILG